MLRLLKVPHFKHWGGPMSERGVPDLVGTVPGTGRALFIEVKRPGGALRPEQAAFLDRHRAAGAVAFVATSARDVVRELAAAGCSDALRVRGMVGG